MMNAEIICATCRHARKSRGLVVACLASCGDIRLAALYGRCRRYDKRISINYKQKEYETDDEQTHPLQ